MAMGRGLTLQCGDDAVNLTRSWNTKGPRLGAGSPKLGLSRRPDATFHGKKHGGHFQLAVNFQSRESPTNQLITPASLLSSVAKEEDQAKDAFKDAHSEEDEDSDDEDSFCSDVGNKDKNDSVEDDDDEEEDDDDYDDYSIGGANSSTSFNYSQTLEEDESSVDDVIAQGSKDNDNDIEDAMEFIKQERMEIEKRQFGFITLEDTINQNGGSKDVVAEKGKLINPRPLSNSCASDKENIDVQDITSLKSSQRISQKSAYQSGIPAEKKPVSLVQKGIAKQPLKTSEIQNVTESDMSESFPTRTNVDEPGVVSTQERLGTDRDKVGNGRERCVNSVNDNKKENLTGVRSMNHTFPVHQDSVSGKEKLKDGLLSPHAAPFIPASSTNGSVKGREGTVNVHTRNRVGPETEPTLWASEYDSQQVNSPHVLEVRGLVPKRKEIPVPSKPVGSSLRDQTTSRLTDKELENEYEWRKYKLIRKVKQILKPQTSDDGQSSLCDNCVSQLCNAMTEASSSFEIFTTYPKELVIVLEEVIRQSVEETELDDVFQKGFITLFHKLSAFSPHFDQDFKTAIKQAEKHFLKPFIGAHLEKLGLRYCQLLGRLYGSFCQTTSSTKQTLEEMILTLCKKWIIFNEKGTNHNAEVTELTFAKCLQTITKEIGPFCPQAKWKQLMDDVKGQIFSKKAQNVKEVFLEILLQSESIASNPSNLESASPESVASGSTEAERPSSENVISSPSKVKCATSELPVKVEDECKETGGANQNLHQQKSSLPGISELNNNHDKTRKLVQHSRVVAKTSKESQSGSESTRRDLSPYRSPYNDSTMATYLSTKLKASSRPKKKKDVSQSNPPVKEKIQEIGHSVGCNGDQTRDASEKPHSKNGQPCDWWDYDAAHQQQREAEVIREEKKRAEEETMAEDGNIVEETHDNLTDINGQSESTEGVSDQEIGLEVWDEQLIPNPSPIMNFSADKRFINGNSLRFQREQYEINIANADKTYEVYVGDESLLHGVVRGDNTTRIEQAEDDVVILENSDSDDDDDDDGDQEDDDEVPLIWGDDLAGMPQRQASSNLKLSAARTNGSLVHPSNILKDNVEINRTLGSSAWNSRPMMVFQELEDNESSLSAIEILAQKALEERRRLGKTWTWQNPDVATEGKVE